jgi:hypothetical protein
VRDQAIALSFEDEVALARRIRGHLHSTDTSGSLIGARSSENTETSTRHTRTRGAARP